MKLAAMECLHALATLPSLDIRYLSESKDFVAFAKAALTDAPYCSEHPEIKCVRFMLILRHS